MPGRRSLQLLSKAVDALYFDGWYLDKIVYHDEDLIPFRSIQYWLTKGDKSLDILSVLHANDEWVVEASSHEPNKELDVFYVYDESCIPTLLEYYS